MKAAATNGRQSRMCHNREHNMKKTLILTTALVSFGFAANADVTVMSWGGAYGAAQTEGHVKP